VEGVWEYETAGDVRRLENFALRALFFMEVKDKVVPLQATKVCVCLCMCVDCYLYAFTFLIHSPTALLPRKEYQVF
jgi:hypothetical protein